MENDYIYLDHCATTPVHPLVLQAMLPYFDSIYGNASSIYHKAGRLAAQAIEQARLEVSQLIHASPKEIIFTSGATEAINQALLGIFNHYQKIGKHIITCETEHPAVLDTCSYLERLGAEVTLLPVNALGEIDLAQLDQAIRKDTIFICLMFANNETGVLHPIAQIGEIAKAHQVLFFCDATQAVGKIPVDVEQQHIDLLALSAHKCYGPKGVGALYIKRKRTPIQVGSLLHGGKQEHQLRAGTLNVPGVVGLGKAAALAQQSLTAENERLKQLRDNLERDLLQLPEITINGTTHSRLPHVTNICFKYVKSVELMAALPQLALSSGSACASGSREPSHVLLAMGLTAEDAHCSIRFSLGMSNTTTQLVKTVSYIHQAVEKIRQHSPLWQMHQAGII
ncbi:IscS subfamily cysteine desulfurase [Olivibacter ginsenosidimutans]|uniref:cysteine desulfurase n=1 Tax=Olivibacter ginsenosidimutans TaxID=1176537 RepID=A0ABP9C9R6_9SPHI